MRSITSIASRRWQSLLAAAALGLAVTSAAIAARPGWYILKRQVATHQAQAVWSQWLNNVSGIIVSGDPAFWLRIPAISIDTLVVHDATEANLSRYPAIARKLENGTPIVLAHRDTHFRRLHELATGDMLMLETADRTINNLTVTTTVIVPKADAESEATKLGTALPAHSLILITCHPPNHIGPAPNRLLIAATRRRLKENRAPKMLEALAPHVEGAGVEDAQAPVRVAKRYLSSRLEQLDYAGAIAAALPIGSGMIEGGHRHVLQKRLKISGAWWKKDNLLAMANLRVCRINQEEDHYWNTQNKAA